MYGMHYLMNACMLVVLIGMLKVKDRVCFAPVFITYNKLYMYVACIFCKTSVTSVLYH